MTSGITQSVGVVATAHTNTRIVDGTVRNDSAGLKSNQIKNNLQASAEAATQLISVKDRDSAGVSAQKRVESPYSSPKKKQKPGKEPKEEDKEPSDEKSDGGLDVLA